MTQNNIFKFLKFIRKEDAKCTKICGLQYVFCGIVYKLITGVQTMNRNRFYRFVKWHVNRQNDLATHFIGYLSSDIQ